LAYLRCVAQPDYDPAFERIYNEPKRGLGDATLATLHEYGRRTGLSLTRAARALVETEELKPRPRQTLRGLLDDFDRWRRQADRIPHEELAQLVLEESGYIDMWKAERTPDAAGRLDNLKELIRSMGEFPDLGAFLEHVSLVMDVESGDEGARVSIMTLHAAKGLEFELVFLPGWEEGLFPNQRALDEGGLKSLEEERRLAYVGLTRARRRAIVSHAANRRIYANWQTSIPSRFVDELPDADVERTGSAALARDSRVLAATTFSGQFPLVARRTRTIEAWEQPSRPARNDAIPVGARVFHQKFGYGRIVAVDGNKLDIEFEKAGPKKVLDSFIEAA